MSGLIGKKIGMTSIFDESGKNIPCTVIEAGPCIVTQVRTEEVDGYKAVQLGFDDKTEKSTTKAAKGHAKKAGTEAKVKVVEFQGFDQDLNLGDTVGEIILKKENLLMSQEFLKEKDFKELLKGVALQELVRQHMDSTTD